MPVLGLICARTNASIMKIDKLQQKEKKDRHTANAQKIRDVFTVICKTDLHVECVKEFRFHPKRLWRFDYAIPVHDSPLVGGVGYQFLLST